MIKISSSYICCIFSFILIFYFLSVNIYTKLHLEVEN